MNDDPTPKILDACIAIYEQMEKDSREATEGRLYEGSFKSAVAQTEFSIEAYYQRAREVLTGMGCVDFLLIGHGKAASLIHLKQAPTPALYRQFRAARSKRKLVNQDELTALIMDLANRVTTLEQDMKSIAGLVRALKKQ